jgi:S1-C subfamily serine protease
MAKQQGALRRSGRVIRGATSAFALSGLAIACGGGHPPAAKTAANAPAAAPTAVEVHERIIPHTCGSRTKLAALLGRNAPAPAPPAEESAESAPAPPTSSVAANTKLAGNQSYRAVAPGTVLIRSEHGMGTGVVIDPRGYILTNNHVIADGQSKDFIITVNVTFGDLTPTGRMARQEKSYDAVVVKVDPVRDLAIVKVKDAPAKLTTVKLAKSAPQIAEKVMSVGHAGIGFLWAAKTCNVASVGERQQDASILAGLDCSRSDPASTAEVAARQKKSCDEQKKRMTDTFLATTQGLAVQTDCAITHGDSGGPLVNAAGELVGLNQSISADLATASFHVHLDEIRDFTSSFGEEPIAVLPDPYCDGGLNPTLEDLDLDGTPDTLVSRGGSMSLFGGYDRMSVFIDLDQDHFTRKKAPSEPFDAEIAMLTIRDTAYVWYDTDGDSSFDLLLVDKGNDGTPDQAYRLDAKGGIKEDKEALTKHDLSAKHVPDKSLHARLGKIALAMGGSKYTSKKTLDAAASSVTVPDPALAAGTEGRAVDTDGNKTPDLVFVRGAFSRGLLIDADEDSLGSLKDGDSADELIKAKKVDAEIAVVVQGNTMGALYDTDNDSKFDLALMTTGATDPSFLYATKGWKLGHGGELTPAPEQVGRKVLRPGLVGLPRAVTALRGSGYDIAADEGSGSLPDPLFPRGKYEFREVKGFPKGTVIEAHSLTSTAMLIDLDRDTKLAANADPAKVVQDGKFDAEVAIVRRGGSEWIYYDTDGDDRFDLVLFVPTPGENPTQAYRLTKGASAAAPMTLEADPKTVPGRPLRHKSVFKDKAMAAKWKNLAAKLFNASSVEE